MWSVSGSPASDVDGSFDLNGSSEFGLVKLATSVTPSIVERGRIVYNLAYHV